MGQVADGIERLVRIGPTERVQREIRDELRHLRELIQDGDRTPIGTSLIGATAGGTQVAGSRRMTGS